MPDILCETTRPATARDLPALLDPIEGVLSGGGVRSDEVVALRRAAELVCGRIIGSKWRATKARVTVAVGVGPCSAWVVVSRRDPQGGTRALTGPLGGGRWAGLEQMVDRVEYWPGRPAPTDESLLLWVDRHVGVGQ